MESHSSGRDREKTGASAPAAAASAAADAPQPDEFPVDFEEWAGQKTIAWQVLVHGFRHELRVHGGLLAKRLMGEWETEFQAFCGRAPKPAPVRRG